MQDKSPGPTQKGLFHPSDSNHHHSNHDGIDWEDVGLAGALAEEMAEAEKVRQLVRKQVEPEEQEDEGDS